MSPGRTLLLKGQGARYIFYLVQVKKSVVIALKVFSLKRSTAENFAVPIKEP